MVLNNRFGGVFYRSNDVVYGRKVKDAGIGVEKRSHPLMTALF